jgi:hypothetical protein
VLQQLGKITTGFLTSTIIAQVGFSHLQRID